jgi:hypothetical protein
MMAIPTRGYPVRFDDFPCLAEAFSNIVKPGNNQTFEFFPIISIKGRQIRLRAAKALPNAALLSQIVPLLLRHFKQPEPWSRQEDLPSLVFSCPQIRSSIVK